MDAYTSGETLTSATNKRKDKMTIIRDEKYQMCYERGRVKIIESLLPQGAGQPALDLGCGSGYFSQLLANRGWVVTAVDKELENILAAKRFARRGIMGVLPGVLESLEKESFRFILALEVIEHLDATQGKTLVEKIWQLTIKGGELLISTPNQISQEGLGGYYWGEKTRGWGKWNAWDSTHLKIYTPSEFLKLLRQVGWKVKTVIGYWYEGMLPLGILWRLPITSCRYFPFNKLGFNIMAHCRKV